MEELKNIGIENNDNKISEYIKEILQDPICLTLFNYTFPYLKKDEIEKKILKINTIDKFQKEVIYRTLSNNLSQTCNNLTVSGLDNLNKNDTYIFLSNHRDIVKDSCLVNKATWDAGLGFLFSAIGDNLVETKEQALSKLFKINRTFLIKRTDSHKELVKELNKTSEFINHILFNVKKSIWIAQREGRTKDGYDQTYPGVLKMISLISKKNKQQPLNYIKTTKIVPVSISYEYDPTDHLKLKELIYAKKGIEYIKSADEDFNSILKGLKGYKGNIHVSFGTPIEKEIDSIINNTNILPNEQFSILAKCIDSQIYKNYKLWPSNYIAYDLLKNHSDNYHNKNYNLQQYNHFINRMNEKTKNDKAEKEILVTMYANPVINKKNGHQED